MQAQFLSVHSAASLRQSLHPPVVQFGALLEPPAMGLPPHTWLLLLLVALVAPQASSAQPTDAELLLWFKGNFTNGTEALPSWQPGTDPCTGWTGVTCTDGRVTLL